MLGYYYYLLVKEVLDNMVMISGMFKFFVMIGWCLGWLVGLKYLVDVMVVVNENVVYMVFMIS